MPNDRCPRCGSPAVYKMRNGIISGDKHVYVRGLSLLTPRTDRMTYPPSCIKKMADNWETRMNIESKPH